MAAIGLFGEGLQLGEAVKELQFGALGHHLLDVLGANPFRYKLTGDIEQEGMAFSIVFANTPSTGAGLGVAHGTPAQPYLELSLHAGENRRDLMGDLISSTVLHRHQADQPTRRFQRVRVETTPAEPVLAAEAVARVYADHMELRTRLSPSRPTWVPCR